MKEEARDWLEQAERELDDGLYMYEDGRQESAAFHLHQAVEKALKALQIEETGEYQRSHDLVELADADIRDRFLPVLRDLTPVYTGIRYPDVELETLALDEHVDDVEELVVWIRKQLTQ